MLDKYIPKRFANALLKHVIAVTLLVPYYYSKNGNLYYQDFILAMFFVILFMFTVFTSWKLDFRKNIIPVSIIGTLLIVYNGFATYINLKYHHWYSEQIHTTLAFLFLIVLLLVKDSKELIDDRIIKATIHTIVISNILALMYRSLDQYSSLMFFNQDVLNGNFVDDEKHFSWLYLHKSQYSLLLVLGVAFFTVFRSHFRNLLTYCLSQALLLVALYYSKNYVCMVAALLIFGAQFADYWWKAKWKIKLLSLIVFFLPLILIAKELYEKIAAERNIFTLGSRTLIWSSFWEYILSNPNGIGSKFGFEYYGVANLFPTNNSHNIFLNHMFRFSIPVGAIYILIFLVLITFCIIKRPSFLSLGIWLAILMSINMDYSLFTSETPFFLFIIYCIFFRDNATKKALS